MLIELAYLYPASTIRWFHLLCLINHGKNASVSRYSLDLDISDKMIRRCCKQPENGRKCILRSYMLVPPTLKEGTDVYIV